MNQTSPSSGIGSVNYSLSEIQAQCRKAARGAGLTWGLAEEAGMACRWLASFDLPGPQVLAELLSLNDGKPYETLCPAGLDGNWNAVEGRLCPLITGATLSDSAAEIMAGRQVVLAAVAFPMLLLPFLGLTAKQHGVALALRYQGTRVTCLSDGISISGDVTLLQTAGARHVVCSGAELAEPTHRPSAQSRKVDVSTWATLEFLAHRTYVPSTAESRAGAGSTLSDNQ